MEFLNSLVAFLQSDGVKQSLEIVVGLGIVDLLMRRFPSSKPLSVLRGFSAFLKAGIRAAQAVDALLDKLVPQKLAAPVLPENNSEVK